MRFRRFIVGGTQNLTRKNRFRHHNDDCEIFDNDANIMALSCTAADEEIVPLSPNRAERIVCKNRLAVDSGNSTHPAHNEYLEQRAELLKGINPPPKTIIYEYTHTPTRLHFVCVCMCFSMNWLSLIPRIAIGILLTLNFHLILCAIIFII